MHNSIARQDPTSPEQQVASSSQLSWDYIHSMTPYGVEDPFDLFRSAVLLMLSPIFLGTSSLAALEIEKSLT